MAENNATTNQQWENQRPVLVVVAMATVTAAAVVVVDIRDW
jgi:hypothetical protein